MEEISPCRGCDNTEEGIIKCRDTCERLKAYQDGLPYEGIEMPDMGLAMLFQEEIEKGLSEESEPSKKDLVSSKNYLQKAIDTKKQPSETIADIKTEVVVEEKKEKPIEQYTNELCFFCKKRKPKTAGLCRVCYPRWWKGSIRHPIEGEWRPAIRRVKKPAIWPECLIEGCLRDGDKKELCERHYKQWYTGSIEHPTLGKFVLTRKKKEKPALTIIDLKQYPELLSKIRDIAKVSFLPVSHTAINLLCKAINTVEEEKNNPGMA